MVTRWFYSWPALLRSLLLFPAEPSAWQSQAPSPSWFVSALLHTRLPSPAEVTQHWVLFDWTVWECGWVIVRGLAPIICLFINWPVCFWCIPYLSCQPASPPPSSAPWPAWSQHLYAWPPPAVAAAPPSSSPGPGRRQPVKGETNTCACCTSP